MWLDGSGGPITGCRLQRQQSGVDGAAAGINMVSPEFEADESRVDLTPFVGLTQALSGASVTGVRRQGFVLWQEITPQLESM